MQEHIQLTQKEINQDLLSGVLGMPKWWLGLVTFLLLVFLAGAGAFLKEQRKDIAIACADPMGAAMYHYYKHGELKSEGNSITEGIGQGRITGNLEGMSLDDAYQIPDEEALPVLFDLLKKEGLCLGASSGINVAGAIRLARNLGPGHTIVTILADFGTRYQSKLWNPAFLKKKSLPVPDWLEGRL